MKKSAASTSVKRERARIATRMADLVAALRRQQQLAPVAVRLLMHAYVEMIEHALAEIRCGDTDQTCSVQTRKSAPSNVKLDIGKQVAQKPVAARRCKGCGKTRGCDAYDRGGYWHLKCLLRERARERALPECVCAGHRFDPDTPCPVPGHGKPFRRDIGR